MAFEPLRSAAATSSKVPVNTYGVGTSMLSEQNGPARMKSSTIQSSGVTDDSSFLFPSATFPLMPPHPMEDIMSQAMPQSPSMRSNRSSRIVDPKIAYWVALQSARKTLLGP